MFPEFILRFLPIVILGMIGFSTLVRNKPIAVPQYVSLFICVAFAFAIAALPEDFSIDKPRYVALFHYGYRWGLIDDYKDPGWMVYIVACARLFKDNVYFFFLLTALIYVFSYYFFSKHFFGKYSFYYIIMSMGCLGYMAYATNTIRAGFAIAFLLIGFAIEKKTWTLIFLLLSVLFHRSMVIPVVCYYLTSFLDKRWIYISVWIICLVLAIVNVNLESLYETLGFIDDRVDVYAGSLETEFSRYKKGFRLDFVIYSIVPLIISLYNIKKKNIEDAYLSQTVNIYILVNSIWLLAIRIAYSDRLAYLSWFLIPFITLYPVIKYQDRYSNPNVLAFGIMSVFLGLAIILMLT